MKTIDLSKDMLASSVTSGAKRSESEFHNRSTTPSIDQMMKLCVEELEP